MRDGRGDSDKAAQHKEQGSADTDGDYLSNCRVFISHCFSFRRCGWEFVNYRVSELVQICRGDFDTPAGTRTQAKSTGIGTAIDGDGHAVQRVYIE